MESSGAQLRATGGTERSWLKAAIGGTGTTAHALLLSPAPSVSSLLSALHRLQLSFPLLRSTLSSTSFSISPLPSLRLHSLDPSTFLSPSSPPLLSLLRNELNVNSWEDPSADLFQATLYLLPDADAVLVLRVHSAIADRTSGFTISRRLIELIGGSEEASSGGGELVECVEDLIPAEYRKKAFWKRGKDMLGHSLDFMRSSHLSFVDDRSKRETDLVTMEFTAGETRKLLDVCKERGIKLCGVLTAAVLLAAVSSKQQSGNKPETYCAITLVDCRNRLSKPLTNNDIGFYHSAVQNFYTVKKGEGLWNVSTRCYDSLCNTLNDHKHFTDMADLNFLMLKAIQTPQVTPSSSLRTALVSIFEEPAVYDSALFYKGTCVKDYLGCSSVHGVGPSIALFDAIWDGQLSCACLYPSPLHSKKQMLELVDSMKNLILGAIAP